MRVTIDESLITAQMRRRISGSDMDFLEDSGQIEYREKMEPTEAQALLKRACMACVIFLSS